MLDIHNAHAWSKKKVAKWRVEPLPPDLQVVVLTTGPWTFVGQHLPNQTLHLPLHWNLDWFLGFHHLKTISAGDCFTCEKAVFCTLRETKNKKQTEENEGTEGVEPTGYGSLGWDATTVPWRRRSRRSKTMLFMVGKSGEKKEKGAKGSKESKFPTLVLWIILLNMRPNMNRRIKASGKRLQY